MNSVLRRHKYNGFSLKQVQFRTIFRFYFPEAISINSREQLEDIVIIEKVLSR